MNFAITIAALGTYDFPGAIHKINLLGIENSGGGDVYLGAIPPAPVTRLANSDVALEYLALVTDTSGTAPAGAATSNAIYPGMVVSDGDGNVTVGTTVLSCNANKVIIDQVGAASADGGVFTFTAPAIDATTGITIPAGQRLWLTAAQHAYLLQQGLRFYSTDGTTLKFLPKYN